MIKDVVSIGDKLEIISINSKHSDLMSNHVYISQMLDFIDNNKAVISMPIKKGHIIPLPIGEKYILYFYTDKGLFQCNVIVSDRYKLKNIYVLVVEFLSDLEKIQRRQYYRIDCLMDTIYHVITEKEQKLTYKIIKNEYENNEDKQTDIETLEEYKKIWYEGTITDLSGGGARFYSSNLHQPGETILLSLDLGTNSKGKKLMIPSSIISSIKMTNRQGYFEHRIMFTNISRDDREMVIKFIFAEERRQRKREKGLD
ncbi:MAG: hypothetical protein K0R21_411 [Anaerocolumna sp.]|jgi:c-di-GMP-binding flagellar brake protein YcgR|nr:hypothetical protein [Anaerocolumna sp.]